MTEYKLTQKGRWIYIRPFPEPKLLLLLETEFSYLRNGYEFMPNPEWGMVKLYQRGNGRFPIGLLQKTEQILTDHGFTYTNLAHRANLVSFYQKDDSLYAFQQKAVKTALKEHGGILQIPTGGGKTRTAISVINTLKVPTLVIVPTLDLVRQWKEQVSDKIHVRTYQGLKSKKYIQQFELVIFDECHRVAAKTLQKIGLNLNETAITLGLSATPFMRNDDNLKVESILGPVVFKISLRQLIDEGYLVDALIHFHKLDTILSDFMDYPMVYNAYIDKNTQRNFKIVRLARESKGPVLILVNHIEHGTFLTDYLEKLNQDVIFLNGSCKDRSDLNYKIIIATSIFDEGIDIPRLETLIIAGGGKSAIKTTQRVGRVLRKYPGKKKAMIHDFADDVKYLTEHYNERRAIYEKDFEVVDVR